MAPLRKYRSLIFVVVATAAVVVTGAVVESPEPVAQASVGTGAVRGKITVKKKGGKGNVADRSKVVVAVHAKGKLEKTGAEVHQHDRQFVPDLTVVTKNSVVEFPNDDKVFHNVFSLSKAARFDLGLYKSGSSKSVKLRREGVVNVYCNIHPEMVAQIKVVDTPYYAVTGKDGSFSIEGIPPGTYPITAWLPYGKEFEGEVTVAANETKVVNMTVTAGSKPKKHVRKDGTPYTRYQ